MAIFLDAVLVPHESMYTHICPLLIGPKESCHHDADNKGIVIPNMMIQSWIPKACISFIGFVLSLFDSYSFINTLCKTGGINYVLYKHWIVTTQRCICIIIWHNFCLNKENDKSSFIIKCWGFIYYLFILITWKVYWYWDFFRVFENLRGNTAAGTLLTNDTGGSL